MKYIIELEKIEGTDLYKAVGANTLVFDEWGIKNILKPLPESEPNPGIDWSKVAVDTPILVRDFNGVDWIPRYFAKYENGLVYAWDSGATSFSAMSDSDFTGWLCAKLAEEEE